MCTAGKPSVSEAKEQMSPERLEAPAPPALTGIITARQLEDALAASGDTVYLAHNARLSPLAADLAREVPDRISRLSADANPSSSTGQASKPWMLYAESMLPAVQEVRNALGSRLTPMPVGQGERGLIDAITRIAQNVKNANSGGGVIITATPQIACVYANTCPSLRAAVFTDDQRCNLRDALALNVLIFPKHVTSSIAKTVVTRELSRAPQPAPQAKRTLEQLATL